MTPCVVVFGRLVLSYGPGTASYPTVELELCSHDWTMKEVQQNISEAQIIMKNQSDNIEQRGHLRMTIRCFSGYIHLERSASTFPNRQNYLLNSMDHLRVGRIGALAYRLQLPPNSKMHSLYPSQETVQKSFYDRKSYLQYLHSQVFFILFLNRFCCTIRKITLFKWKFNGKVYHHSKLHGNSWNIWLNISLADKEIFKREGLIHLEVDMYIVYGS